MSETDGNLHNGYSTQCDLERVKLVNLMTAGNIDYENLEINTNDSAISEIEDMKRTTVLTIRLKILGVRGAKRFYVKLNPQLLQMRAIELIRIVFQR